MRSVIQQGRVLVGVVLLTGACASSQEWAEWANHSSHFASGQHMDFSLRNTQGRPVRATRSDVAAARAENWWGQALTVQSDQILER